MRKITALSIPMALLVVTIACGDAKSPTSPSATPSPAPAPAPSPDPAPAPSPSPTPTPDPTPTPPPTPTPDPTPTPTPPPPVGDAITFTADGHAGARSFSLEYAATEGDDVLVTLRANDFGPDFENLLAYVRATISYDPAKVEAVSFKRGDWLNGSYTVTKPGSNQVKIRVDAATGDDWKSGSGDVLRLRFRKKVSGSSRLDFVEGIAYNGGYDNRLVGTSGGTINAN
jgi:hypothetical protein